MTKPDAAKLEAAARVLARETRESDGVDERAAAARLVYDRTIADLSRYVGLEAARALLARSAKLAAPEHPVLGTVDLAPAERATLTARIESSLRGASLSTVEDATTALYATLLMLLERLVGERITAKLILDARPGATAASKETKE